MTKLSDIVFVSEGAFVKSTKTKNNGKVTKFSIINRVPWVEITWKGGSHVFKPVHHFSDVHLVNI